MYICCEGQWLFIIKVTYANYQLLKHLEMMTEPISPL